MAALNHGDVEQLFRRFDFDGDGKLSPSELRLCMRNAGDEISDEDAEEIVGSLDSDGDGLLGLEDFVGLVGDGCEEEMEEGLRQAFRVYAEKGMGCITAPSLRAALRVVGEAKGMEECEKMISRFDLDGDGVISFDEFRIMMA